MNADEQIRTLLKKYPAEKVQSYMHSLVAGQEAKEKMLPYFDKPTPEKVN